MPNATDEQADDWVKTFVSFRFVSKYEEHGKLPFLLVSLEVRLVQHLHVHPIVTYIYTITYSKLKDNISRAFSSNPNIHTI